MRRNGVEPLNNWWNRFLMCSCAPRCSEQLQSGKVTGSPMPATLWSESVRVSPRHQRQLPQGESRAWMREASVERMKDAVIGAYIWTEQQPAGKRRRSRWFFKNNAQGLISAQISHARMCDYPLNASRTPRNARLSVINLYFESIFYDIIDKNVDIALDFFKDKLKWNHKQ